jgi:putative flippase GtrA
MTAHKAAPRLPPWLTQAVKFGLVGVLNTALDWGVYYLLTRFAGMGGLPTLAKAISYGIGVLNSYFWNRRWTFGSQAGAAKTLLPFVLVNLVGTGINSGMMALSTGLFHLPEVAGLALATVAALSWNFAASKFLVFRK